MSKEALTICLMLLVLGLTLPTIGKIIIAMVVTYVIATAVVSMAARSVAGRTEG